MAKIEIKNFDDWDIYEGAAEGSGRSEKVWLEKDGKVGVFKFPKPIFEAGEKTSETTKEYLSEELAYLIAEQIDIKSAKVDIGIRNGRIGSMSYRIPEKLEILMEGIYCISSCIPSYNQDKLYDYKTKEYYSLQMIENSIKSIVPNVPEDFYKMLIFDFIIGNSDRHHSNWAFVIRANIIENSPLELYAKFSPLYDNGSSLCAFIKEKDITKYTRTKDKMLIDSLINTKSKSIIRIDPKSKKLPTQLEFLNYLKKTRYNNIIDYVEDVIKKLDSNCISNILNMFDDDIMSIERKELLSIYLNGKMSLLKDVFYGKGN